ncbi:MAG: hypothetical protein ACRC1H_01535 [Caldilineaceae bacterium]
MTNLQTAQQFFLPLYEGDHSAFQPYELGEVSPDDAEMNDFIEATFDGARCYLEGKDPIESVGRRSALRLAVTAYRDDANYARDLRAWCLAKAIRAYNAE